MQRVVTFLILLTMVVAGLMLLSGKTKPFAYHWQKHPALECTTLSLRKFYPCCLKGVQTPSSFSQLCLLETKQVNLGGESDFRWCGFILQT